MLLDENLGVLNKPAIYLEDAHYERLHALATAFRDRLPEASRLLLEEIERADILEESDVGRPVVTIGAKVRFHDDTTGRVRTVRVVWPNEADIAERRISVLTPIGAALIGMPEGGQINWTDRSGATRSLTVLRIEGGRAARR